MMHKEGFHLTVSENILTQKSLRNWEVLVTYYIVQKFICTSKKKMSLLHFSGDMTGYIIPRACAVWACVCMGQCKNGSFYQSVTLTVNFQHRRWCVSINAAWLVKMSELHELWAQQPCMLFDEICMTLAEL